MKITDAVTDRIQQRREKLERAGVIAPEFDGASPALTMWQVDAWGHAVPIDDHPQGARGIDIVAIPTGKFLHPDFAKYPRRQTAEHWAAACAETLVLPDERPQLPPLFDAPPPLPMPVAVIDTGLSDATPEPPAEPEGESVLISIADHRAKIRRRPFRWDVDGRR